MSDTGNTLGDLAGLALAITVLSLSWPAARRQLKLWTRLQWVKAGLSLLLCIVVALLWIPLADLLTLRNTAGQAPSGAGAGAVLVMLGWSAFSILWLTRYWVRILATGAPPATADTQKPPRWLRQFGVVDIVFLVIVAAGIGVMLAVRHG